MISTQSARPVLMVRMASRKHYLTIVRVYDVMERSPAGYSAGPA